MVVLNFKNWKSTINFYSRSSYYILPKTISEYKFTTWRSCNTLKFIDYDYILLTKVCELKIFSENLHEIVKRIMIFETICTWEEGNENRRCFKTIETRRSNTVNCTKKDIRLGYISDSYCIFFILRYVIKEHTWDA